MEYRLLLIIWAAHLFTAVRCLLLFGVTPEVYTTNDQLQVNCAVDPVRNIFHTVSSISLFRNGNVINLADSRINVTRYVTSPALSATLVIQIKDLHCSGDEGAYRCLITGTNATNSGITLLSGIVDVHSRLSGVDLSLSHWSNSSFVNGTDKYPLGTKLLFECSGEVGKPAQTIRWCVDPEGLFSPAEERPSRGPQQCHSYDPNTCQTTCVSIFEYTVEKPSVEISCSVDFYPVICKGRTFDAITINGGSGLTALYMITALLTTLSVLNNDLLRRM